MRPALASAVCRRNARAIDEEFADAHEGRRHVSERREIAGGADRALTGNDRDQVRLQAGRQMLDGGPAHARRALREARELERHHEPHDRNGQRLADAGGMREHDVALERREIGGADAHARELSEAGVDAIDRLALGDDGLDGLGAGLDGGAAILIERDLGAEIDAAPVGQGDGAGMKRYGLCHCPLQMRA